MEDLRDMLIRHEGLRLKPYLDTQGIVTIGVGRNLESNGISQDEAMMLLEHDIERAEKDAAGYPWFAGLNVARQNVIVSMLFNLGKDRFAGFGRLIDALEKSDFQKAADEMLSSKWAGQVRNRAVELAIMMRG